MKLPKTIVTATGTGKPKLDELLTKHLNASPEFRRKAALAAKKAAAEATKTILEGK